MSTQTTRHFINGVYTEGASGRTFENRRPIDNALISHVCEAGRADVDTAVQAARAAWASTRVERTYQGISQVQGS